MNEIASDIKPDQEQTLGADTGSHWSPQQSIRAIRQRFFRVRPEDTLPRTVTHERIYIVPSRRGWVFLISLLIMLIGAINYNLSLGYALCFLLTGLFAASLIATYRNLSGIQILRINQPEATLGEKLHFSLALANTSKIERAGIDVGNGESLCRIDVRSHAENYADIHVPTKKRGLQTCGRITISSDFPLGLWITWSYVHFDSSGLVYPRAEISPPALPYRNEQSNDGHSRVATQGDFESLREYQPGDSPGSIAWKTVARGMGLYTRQFAAENPATELVLRWQDTRSLNDVEHRLSRLAAWAKLAHKQGIEYTLEIPEGTLGPASSEQHLRQTLKALALHGSTDAYPRH